MVTTLCVKGNIWSGLSSQTGTLKKSSVLMLARVQAQLENALRERPTPAPTLATVPPRPPSLQVDEPKAYTTVLTLADDLLHVPQPWTLVSRPD